MSTSTKNLLLDPREFRLLDGMRLNPRKSFAGRVRGERLTQRKGISIEFNDYRDYTEGDDLRHLDWNVLARLDTPIMKTYRDEEDLAVHLLLDASASMDFGEPTKLEAGAKLAAAIGYLGLNGGDAVYPRLLARRKRPMAALRGRASYPRLASWASSANQTQADGPAQGLSLAVRGFVNSSARAGLVVLITDGMDPEAPNAIRQLGGRGHEIAFLHILSDLELDPDLEGDLRLLDCETSADVEITANSYTMREYRQRLDDHLAALREATQRAGGRYALVDPKTPFDKVVKDVLKREGWAR
jgi:uncharacterized protein (DUF58 family)